MLTALEAAAAPAALLAAQLKAELVYLFRASERCTVQVETGSAPGEVVATFGGGRFGDHRISVFTYDGAQARARALAHARGYLENQAA